MSTRFVLAQGRISLPSIDGNLKMVVVSTRGAVRLHEGAELGREGLFELTCGADPRPEWEARGIHQISFVLDTDDGPRPMATTDRRVAFHLAELPLSDLQLHVEKARVPQGAAALGGTVVVEENISVLEVFKVGGDRSHTPPLGLDAHGAEVGEVQAHLVKAGFAVPAYERSARRFGVGTQGAVRQLQRRYQLPETGVVDDATRAALANAVQAAGVVQVQGRIIVEHGSPARCIPLRLYNRGVGEHATLLGETTTDGEGYYAIGYQTGAAAANLEIRTVDSSGHEVSLSTTRFSAARREVLNLVAPSVVQPLAAEYRRLTSALTPHLGARGDVGAVREEDECRDLTLLHQATGWDARLIALAATAAQRSASTGIAAEALYALFRAGLPTDAPQLATVSPATVAATLASSARAGIVALDEAHITTATAAFTRFAYTARRAAKTPDAVSSFGELLDQSGLEGAMKDAFADLYFTAPSTDVLWDQSAKAGIPTDKIAALQLQGRLAFLTRNSAALVAALRSDGIDVPERLVEHDLHDAQRWRSRIERLAGDDESKLAALIPAAYSGEHVNDRLDAYAADMARRVRLSFPTQTVARMIGTDQLQLGDRHADLKQPVQAFLSAATALGFSLGQTPVDTFVQAHQGELFPDGTAQATVDGTVQAVKRLVRLYQVTPSNNALQTVYQLGLQSAHQMAAFDGETFVASFGSSFASTEEARLVHRKAQQVDAVTRSLFASAKLMDSSPTVYGTSPNERAIGLGQPSREIAKAELVKRFPTLGQLFGSLDFCECEHCRSVLGPAAYLVDLLQFVDVSQADIQGWEKRHGQTYAPHLQPFKVLTGPARRPDLPLLPLTCENTNTVLPYIDIVNEILEYSVVHHQLDGGAVHDTGDAASADLIAEPQHLLVAAYTALQGAKYPLRLPFNLWIETVRRFLDRFDVKLWQVLDLFRQSDEPFVAAPFQRVAVFAEYLGVTPEEYDLLTAPQPLTDWFSLYGYASENAAKAALPSAKTLAQRLGVSYRELIDLVKAGFLNPQLETDLAKALVLHDPDPARCDFAGTTLHHTNGDAAEPLVFLKFNLFVRLWRRLGWSIDELDRALQVFVPKFRDLKAADVGPGLRTALLYLAHLETLAARLALGKSSRIPLLTLWSDLPTTGEHPLYSELFLVPGVANDAFVFGSNGKVLTNVNVSIGEQLPALQAAIGLVADDIDRILDDAALDRAAVLSLPHVSLLYRHALLARALRMSVRELLALKAMVGQRNASGGFDAIDPYAPLTGSAVTKLADDHPLVQTLGFVERAQAVLSSGLRVADVDYLLRHQREDPAGQYRVDPAALLNVALAVAGDVRDVRAAHPAPMDPTAYGDDQLRQDLAAVLPVDAVSAFAALLAGTFETEVSRSSVAPTARIDAAAFADPALRVTYDPTRRAQRLAWRGLLLDRRKANIEGVAAPQLLKDLLDEAQSKAYRAVADQLQTVLDRLTATSEFAAVQDSIQLADALDPAALAFEPAIRVTYDGLNKKQHLAYRGVLLAQRRAQIEQKVSVKLLSQLLGAIQAQGQALTGPLAQAVVGIVVGTVTLEASATKVAPIDQIDAAAFASEPAVTVTYDATSQVQRLHYRGLLTASHAQTLASLSTKTSLPGLLANLQAQAQDLLKKLRVGLLAGTDFDGTFQNVEKLAKGSGLLRLQLARGILPLVDERLVLERVVQRIATSDVADPTLVEALLTDTQLVSDPTEPAERLLSGFLAVGDEGVTAAFYASQNGTGVALREETSTAVTTGDRPSGAQSARFAGYLTVPVGGAYRFFVTLGSAATQAVLRVGDGPDALVAATAAADGDEASQFVDLKAGVPYAIALDVDHLGAKDVRLEVQGENLPRGSLDRLALYPAAGVVRLDRAATLLAKVLQLVKGLALDEAELRHLLLHRTDFDGLDLRALPTTDNEVVPARALFERFLRLVGYASLKRDLSPGTDDLVQLFAAARGSGARLPDLHQRVADLTRRPLSVVADLAAALHLQVAHFASEIGVGRLWRGLQVVEKLGVPVAALVKWANPRPDDKIARAVRDAIKARFPPDTWRQVATDIFDPLRRRKRDALVAFLMHRDGLERVEQLYEAFLVDPGMEPVVQTSRLRLALASVQLFIQRCLLNLEKDVPPSILPAEQWEWMKRYRVWEANRKIFLFPEDWLEPEFRDDKTHLYTALEGALLQGDVTNELAEDALFRYLQGLEQIARLEIVSAFLDPTTSVLHVVGRTHSLPHRYFYRSRARGTWTPWDPVGVEIEGDHVVVGVWRHRVHLFWVTFLVKTRRDANVDKDATIYDLATKKVSQTSQFEEVQAQLHWSDYFQGRWSPRSSSGFDVIPPKVPPQIIKPDFSPSQLYVHVVKEQGDAGDDGVPSVDAVTINVVGPLSFAFRLVSRNAPPASSPAFPAEESAYGDADVVPSRLAPEVTHYDGKDMLTVTWQAQITTTGTMSLASSQRTEAILAKVHPYDLVLSPARSLDDAKTEELTRPFFFQDDRATFHVEPSVSESEFSPSGQSSPYGTGAGASGDRWNPREVQAHVARVPNGPSEAVDENARYEVATPADWLTDPATVLAFGAAVVGRSGGTP